MNLTPDDILNEYAERTLAKKAPNAFALSREFAQQTAFIEDPARLKACLCTRRSGKSYGAGLYLFSEALANPGVTCVYIALTRSSAANIMWRHVLKAIDKKFALGCKFNKTALSVELPNGSLIYLVGADATEAEREKLLGQKFRLVIIDEAASFTIDLYDLVYKVLKPATADEQGTVALIGTPSNIKKSLFFDVTTGREAGWSVHKWSGFNNPFMVQEWTHDFEELKAKSPLIVETPYFKQMWLGEWVTDDDARVYKFDDARNAFKGELPTYARGSWHYILGIDLGYEDATAFVPMAYHDYSPTLYVLSSFKKSKMDVTAVAETIKGYQRSYSFDSIVIDGANKQAVQEIQNRHSIPLQAASKTGKADFIEILNGELIQGKIRFQQPACESLIDEMYNLVWNERSAKREEHPNCENHSCDAFLYGWRYAYTFLAEKPTASPAPGSPEYFERIEDEMARHAEEMHNRSKQQDDPWATPPTEWSGNGW